MAANAQNLIKPTIVTAGTEHTFDANMRSFMIKTAVAGGTVDFGNGVAMPLDTVFTSEIQDPNLAGKIIAIATQDAVILETLGTGS